MHLLRREKVPFRVFFKGTCLSCPGTILSYSGIILSYPGITRSTDPGNNFLNPVIAIQCIHFLIAAVWPLAGQMSSLTPGTPAILYHDQEAALIVV
jgi:hypothetical protein